MMACSGCDAREEAVENPWPIWLSFTTMGIAVIVWAIGLSSLARENPKKLPGLLGLLAVGATVARKELCARCPYYGEYCTMLIGKWTALLYERSDKPLNTWVYLLDGAVGGLSFLYPLREVKEHSLSGLLLYLLLGMLFLAVGVTQSCSRCPSEVCPASRTLKLMGFKQ